MKARTILAAAAGAIAFLYFVWPTPWVIVEQKISNGRVSAVLVDRVHRFTGVRERSSRDGWKKIGSDTKTDTLQGSTRGDSGDGF